MTCDGRNSYFVSESVRKILPQLLHAMRSDLGIAVLTGPAGCGKTTLLRHLRHLLGQEGRVVICSGALLDSPAALHQTLWAAAIQRAGENADSFDPKAGETPPRWQIVERLHRSRQLWGPVLLLLDDAHLLSSAVLNELRAWMEDSSASADLIRCLLTGPLSLEEELARPAMSDVSGHIRCHVFLQTLTVPESSLYLQQRFRSAGRELAGIIAVSAIEEIVIAAAGSPRCLNLLTDESLVTAANRHQMLVDADCVRTALQQLQHLPYAWNISYSTDDFEQPVQQVQSASSSTVEFHFTDTDSSALAADSAAYSATPEITESATLASLTDSASNEAGKVHRLPGMIRSTPTSMAVFEFSGESVFELDHYELSDGPEPVTDTTATRATNDSTVTGDETISGADFVDQLLLVLESEKDDICSESAGFEQSNEAEVWGGELSNRLPVFDRYTWVALGREVPPGLTASVSRRHARYEGDEFLFVDAAALNHRPCIEQISVSVTSDQEIQLLLTTTPTGVDHWRDGHWRDGQLLHFLQPAVSESDVSDRTEDEVDSPEVVESQDAFSSMDDDAIVSGAEQNEMISIPFRSHVRSELSAVQDANTESARTEPESKSDLQLPPFDGSHTDQRIHFFTLAASVEALGADRGSEFAPEYNTCPLASDISELQAEVQRFNTPSKPGSHDLSRPGSPDVSLGSVNAAAAQNASPQDNSPVGNAVEHQQSRFQSLFTRLRAVRETRTK